MAGTAFPHVLILGAGFGGLQAALALRDAPVLVTVVVPHFPRRSGRAKGGRLSVVLVTMVELVRIAVLVRIDEMRRVGRVQT